MEQLNTIHQGDALAIAKSLAPNSLDCIVTSPPYFGLRSYLADNHPDKALEVGSEDTPRAYIGRMVALFEALLVALKPSGTCWVNLGDSYSGGGGLDPKRITTSGKSMPPQGRAVSDLPPKNLLMIPARVAIALQDSGWILRSEIIWHKPAPMPEPVKDRPTKAHEVIYLLTKSERYWYDMEAVSCSPKSGDNKKRPFRNGDNSTLRNDNGNEYNPVDNVNLRSVWTIPHEPSTEAHYATYPTEIPRRCIRLGCPPDGVVYDPFMGSGTTAIVAIEQNRQWVGSELNPDYIAIATRRVAGAIELRKETIKLQKIAEGQTVEVAPNITQHGLFSGGA